MRLYNSSDWFEKKTLQVCKTAALAEAADLEQRSKVMTPNESFYRISYMCSIQIESLSLAVFVIFVEKSI